ncbi:MAG: hypothetical protein AAFX76_02075 [Planctomycetota bacterium]
MIDETIQSLAQFGAAGLMGTLWVWERTMTRRRESQLTAVHKRLMSERHQLRELMRVVHRNTRAIERFEQSQNRLQRTLERMGRDGNQRVA